MIDLDSKDWKLFRTYAALFYRDAIKVMMEASNDPTVFPKLLDRLPSLLEVYEKFWKKEDKRE